jgi:apolipoprotein N-acyltransferase
MTRESWDADLIIWPETALPAFQHQARELLAQLGQEARGTNTDLLIGVPVMELDSRRYFNSMVSIGARDQSYSKQHLVPFGEYIPWNSFLGRVMEIMQVPLPDFSVMPSSPVLTLAGQPMGISICYEDAFGGEVIRALPEATALVNASNDAWFGDSLAPHQHLEMARMRSIETQRPMLRVTNTGVTAIIDHRGRITDAAPQFTVAVLRGRVQPMRGATPYARMGNTPLIAVVSLLLALALWTRRASVARLA